MLAKAWGTGIRGVNGYLVSVEADVSPGLPTFSIVGLPDAEVRESRERVAAAIKNSGFDFPLKKVTVNLGPAELKKSGTHLDLPIAAAILSAAGQLSRDAAGALERSVLIGELSLDGTVRPSSGVLPMLMALKNSPFENIIAPAANEPEASVTGLAVFAADTLTGVMRHIDGAQKLRTCAAAPSAQTPQETAGDFSEVKGQFLAKRALEIAAAGGHNVLMTGTPGSGKSMLAKRFPGILPPMTDEEALEVTRVYSVCGLLREKTFITHRPFRDPHHTISDIALIGGGSTPRPGEVSLAHNGVLFLDELPEFSRSSLEVLREPLENASVTIARAKETLVFPARFTLIAAMNPCPCGYSGHTEKPCTCTPVQISRYRSRISGPLLDRIDLTVKLSPIKYGEWQSSRPAETSADIRKRVIAARARQLRRFAGTSTKANAFMSVSQLRKYCVLPPEGGAILETAMKKLGLSARSLDKILKVARTIADLEGCEEIRKEHLMEVIQYRSADKTGGI